MTNAIDSKAEEIKTEVLPPPPPRKLPHSIKTWSENKQKFFYRPLDPEYTMRHYYKHKRDMECAICGSVVTTQMHKHVKSRKCLLVKEAVQKTIEKLQSM
jgi:hypothetical protein